MDVNLKCIRNRIYSLALDFVNTFFWLFSNTNTTFIYLDDFRIVNHLYDWIYVDVDRERCNSWFFHFVCWFWSFTSMAIGHLNGTWFILTLNFSVLSFDCKSPFFPALPSACVNPYTFQTGTSTVELCSQSVLDLVIWWMRWLPKKRVIKSFSHYNNNYF